MSGIRGMSENLTLAARSGMVNHYKRLEEK